MARAAAASAPSRCPLTMRPTLSGDLLGQSAPYLMDIAASIRTAAFSLSKRARRSRLGKRHACGRKAASYPRHQCDCKHALYRPCRCHLVRCSRRPHRSPGLNAKGRRSGLGPSAKLNIAAIKAVSAVSRGDSVRCRPRQPIVTLESKCSHLDWQGAALRSGETHPAFAGKIKPLTVAQVSLYPCKSAPCERSTSLW
jgi:hypothetical protein